MERDDDDREGQMLPRGVGDVLVWEAGLRGKAVLMQAVLMQAVLQHASDPAAAARVASVREFSTFPLCIPITKYSDCNPV